MLWKPKYYLIYDRRIIDELKRTEDWSFICAGNLPDLVKDVLKVKSIGSEIKLIWSDDHRRWIMKEYNVTSVDIDDYIKANCSLLSFKTESLMKRAEFLLKKWGAKSEMICLSEYRDVILQQAWFYRSGKFKQE